MPPSSDAIIGLVNTSSAAPAEMAVLIGTTESYVEEILRICITQILEGDSVPTFTIVGTDEEVKMATRGHRYGMVVLFFNTMKFAGGFGEHFIHVLDLIRHTKAQGNPITIVITSYSEPGFGSAAEQAGADAIVDAPFSRAILEQAIRAPMEARA